MLLAVVSALALWGLASVVRGVESQGALSGIQETQSLAQAWRLEFVDRTDGLLHTLLELGRRPELVTALREQAPTPQGKGWLELEWQRWSNGPWWHKRPGALELWDRNDKLVARLVTPGYDKLPESLRDSGRLLDTAALASVVSGNASQTLLLDPLGVSLVAAEPVRVSDEVVGALVIRSLAQLPEGCRQRCLVMDRGAVVLGQAPSGFSGFAEEGSQPKVPFAPLPFFLLGVIPMPSTLGASGPAVVLERAHWPHTEGVDFVALSDRRAAQAAQASLLWHGALVAFVLWLSAVVMLLQGRRSYHRLLTRVADHAGLSLQGKPVAEELDLGSPPLEIERIARLLRRLIGDLAIAQSRTRRAFTGSGTQTGRASLSELAATQPALKMDGVMPEERPGEKKQMSPADEPDVMRPLYDRFLAVRQSCGEKEPITLGEFSSRLALTKSAVVAKHQCQEVDFEVHVRDGRAVIRAVPRPAE